MYHYQIVMETNRKMVFSEEISATERADIVTTLLTGICPQEDILNYKRRMRVNAETDCIYPGYFIPPYNGGRKLRLVQGYLPKTNILYANHYELEILRLLVLFAPENQAVREMVDTSLQRLRNTCFGNSCTQGECFATGICVLRFLTAARPGDLDLLRRGWITGKLSNGKISEGDTYNLMGKYIIRNAIGTLPEYEDVSRYRIYINPDDERCYCDI